MNNYERIKQMSIDELVKFISDTNCYTTCLYQKECHADKNCNEGVKLWLESEKQ